MPSRDTAGGAGPIDQIRGQPMSMVTARVGAAVASIAAELTPRPVSPAVRKNRRRSTGLSALLEIALAIKL
ncbi:hypothetical protein [Arthrobacter roseus]|uniref:hypothetical protein n=1 Tax=Arthrobacter roseus TaxID=136274 RepID=UPI001EF8E4E0|nr:hypothetical protein [Arthrobacter roseus]